MLQKIEYACKPGSQFEVGSGSFKQFVELKCLWKKSWEPTTLPNCKITHCLQPATPGDSLNFNFTWDKQPVKVDDYYTYNCESGKVLESGTRNRSEALNHISVKCKTDGEYEYPQIWPQCSETISCGSPPEALANGTIKWIKGVENNTFYENKIEYTCKPGSQFILVDGHRMNHRIECLWNKIWDPLPLPTCEITNCLKPITPQELLNFNFTWDNNLIDGSYVYPSPWPQCSETVSCGEPPPVPVNGSHEWLLGNDQVELYDTHILYKCVRGSKFDTDNDGIGDSDNITINCQWRKVWSPWPILPKCIITHCVDPLPIPKDSNLEEVNSGWVAINTKKWYQCADKLENGSHTKFFESDRSKSSFSMTCQPNGLFKFVNLRENWPTCLSTVHCGQPSNEPSGGLRTWTKGLELDDTYLTQVKYYCVNGSQFDTNGDLAGDSESITTECMWNKTWSPWSVLPQCFITHCVDPFDIPLNTSLEESTSNWTRINTYKEYRCSRMVNGVHTQFFQYDRTKSSFKMKCLPDGTFDFVNESLHWPVCLEGKVK